MLASRPAQKSVFKMGFHGSGNEATLRKAKEPDVETDAVVRTIVSVLGAHLWRYLLGSKNIVVFGFAT